MSRSFHSAWNFASTFLFTGVTLVTGLVATPLLIRWLGEERLGAYRVAVDWAGYLSLMELGLSGALMPLLAKAAGQKDSNQLRTTLAAGFVAYRRVALAMLGGGIVLSISIPLLVPVADHLRAELRSGVVIGALGAILVQFLPLRALLDATQRGYFTNALLITQSIVVTGLSVACAYAGLGIPGQFGAVLAGAIVLNVMTIRFAGIRGGDVKEMLFSRKADVETWKSLWSLNRPALILNIGGRVSLLTDNIIIGYFLGPAAVVPFFVTQRLFVIIQSQLQAVGSAAWAGMAELHHVGRAEAFVRRLRDLTQLVMVLGCAVTIPTIALNHAFVRLWVGEGQFGGQAVTWFAGGNALMLGLLSLWGWMFSGTGRAALLVPPLIAGTVVNVAVSMFATWRFGLIGPLVGTAVAFSLVQMWWLPMLLRRHFHVPARTFVSAATPVLLAAIPFAALTWWCSRRFPAQGWISLGAQMTTAASMFLVCSWWTVLDTNGRREWLARAKSMWRRSARDERVALG